MDFFLRINTRVWHTVSVQEMLALNIKDANKGDNGFDHVGPNKTNLPIHIWNVCAGVCVCKGQMMKNKTNRTAHINNRTMWCDSI